MGFLKQMKDLKESVEAAPGMVKAARDIGAQAQEMQAAQQAAAQAQMAAFQQASAGAPGANGATGTTDLEPIAGVSIESYVEVSKELATVGYDQSKAAAIAAQKGISQESWNTAVEGWNARIRANPAVGQHFNRLYTGS